LGLSPLCNIGKEINEISCKIPFTEVFRSPETNANPFTLLKSEHLLFENLEFHFIWLKEQISFITLRLHLQDTHIKRDEREIQVKN